MTKPLSTEERFRVTPNEDKALKSLFPLEVTLLKPSFFFAQFFQRSELRILWVPLSTTCCSRGTYRRLYLVKNLTTSSTFVKCKHFSIHDIISDSCDLLEFQEKLSKHSCMNWCRFLQCKEENSDACPVALTLLCYKKCQTWRIINKSNLT